MKASDAEIFELRNAAQALIAQIQAAQKSVKEQAVWGPQNPDEFSGYRKIMKVAAAIGGKHSPELTSELRAVCSMLRCMIASAEYDDNDLKILAECLNLAVTETDGWIASFLKGEPRILAVRAPLLRFIAEDLLRFSRLLVKNEILWMHNPIAVCPCCDGLFLKAKSNQEYCSTRCRIAHWAYLKGKEYFAEKQREVRRNKKEERRKKQRAVIKVVRESMESAKAKGKQATTDSGRPN
jgi:hypothetical protein